jgi:CRISPR system Cascade subunit CasA
MTLSFLSKNNAIGKVVDPMAFSLIQHGWLPVLRQNSGAQHIRPAQLTENIETDPVIAINWPRADFRLATLEFLIGLLATTCPPTGRRHWPELYRKPPSPDALDAAFAPLAFAFELDGDGPRFMQDFEDIVAAPNDVANLLIEAPGDQTIKKNADLLNKRGQVNALSRGAAAMALFTLQTYAPAGGAGNRTGLRGGGPLTTLALPPFAGPLPLWHLLWANVPAGQPATKEEWRHILPWLAPTKTSENDKKVSPAAPHDRLAFWGAPRRIRLDFIKAGLGETCDLTGATDTVLVKSWRQRPNGANYEAFDHPLTPHYKPKPKEPMWLPVHPQPGGIGYRHFLGLIVSPKESGESRRPAAAIITYRANRREAAAIPGNPPWRLLAAGFDMDNMKARGFVEAELPVFEAADPEAAALQDEILAGLINGADEVAGLLRQAVRGALFSDGAKPDVNAGLFTSLRAQFWQQTEPAFYAQAARAATGGAAADVASAFLTALRNTALQLFAETAPITGSDHPERVAMAAKYLGIALSGHGKAGAKLYAALGLQPPEARAKPKGTAA